MGGRSAATGASVRGPECISSLGALSAAALCVTLVSAQCQGNATGQCGVGAYCVDVAGTTTYICMCQDGYISATGVTHNTNSPISCAPAATVIHANTSCPHGTCPSGYACFVVPEPGSGYECLTAGFPISAPTGSWDPDFREFTDYGIPPGGCAVSHESTECEPPWCCSEVHSDCEYSALAIIGTILVCCLLAVITTSTVTGALECGPPVCWLQFHLLRCTECSCRRNRSGDDYYDDDDDDDDDDIASFENPIDDEKGGGGFDEDDSFLCLMIACMVWLTCWIVLFVIVVTELTSESCIVGTCSRRDELAVDIESVPVDLDPLGLETVWCGTLFAGEVCGKKKGWCAQGLYCDEGDGVDGLRTMNTCKQCPCENGASCGNKGSNYNFEALIYGERNGRPTLPCTQEKQCVTNPVYQPPYHTYGPDTLGWNCMEFRYGMWYVVGLIASLFACTASKITGGNADGCMSKGIFYCCVCILAIPVLIVQYVVDCESDYSGPEWNADNETWTSTDAFFQTDCMGDAKFGDFCTPECVPNAAPFAWLPESGWLCECPQGLGRQIADAIVVAIAAFGSTMAAILSCLYCCGCAADDDQEDGCLGRCERALTTAAS